MRDDGGTVFGAYCSEAWRKTLHFYGLGESFVFNFDVDGIIHAYQYSGANEKIQFSDERCIILGGGSSRYDLSKICL